jgi:hypothetical protein
MIVKTRDNFMWFDITAKLKTKSAIKELWQAFELYELTDEGTDHLLESIADVTQALKYSRICIGLGFHKQDEWFHNADKILKDGYWYAKINDIKHSSIIANV